jgi:hypothetical protein
MVKEQVTVFSQYLCIIILSGVIASDADTERPFILINRNDPSPHCKLSAREKGEENYCN